MSKGALGDVTNPHVMRVVDGTITELREYIDDGRREDEFCGSERQAT